MGLQIVLLFSPPLTLCTLLLNPATAVRFPDPALYFTLLELLFPMDGRKGTISKKNSAGADLNQG